ncbi:hypothetical protein [Streptomyces sp. SID2119]|uniref:hypothetical protein n=1 Tax=Streptomyces sp. SID2119 TaxID=2690253 RepID=UPI00136E2C9E|nr:hypothetical protein [Streptomyces sp. SID2119]MYW35099.1 hypothetical protein [Streptomyces sp. SID2119]
MDQEPGHSFNRRVRLLVEVPNQPDETALVEELLTAQGWSVREATVEERTSIAFPRTGRVVEVRLRGARRGARRAAVRRVESLASRAKVPLWVRQSVLLEYPRERRTLYRARLRPPDQGTFAARRLLRLVRQIDGSHDQRALSLAGAPDRARALNELGASRLGGRPFDPEREELTGPPDLPGDAVPPDPWLDPETPGGLWSLALTVVGVLLSMLVCLAVGGLIQALDTPWRWLGLGPVAGAASAAGALVGAAPPLRPRPLVLLGSAAGCAVLVFCGYQLLAVTEGTGGSIALRAVVMPLFVLLALAVGYGVHWALVPSWFSRHASWLVPALLAPLLLLLPWFGRLLYTVYLTIGFGIPVESVPLTTYSMMYAALKPMAVAAGFALFFVGVAGWARHLYWGRIPGESSPTFLLPLSALQYIVTALLLGVLSAGYAWGDAVGAVREGRTPPGYYGLRGTLMCVELKDPDIPVYNAPLVTDRPVVTFGASGERVWLWAPSQRGSGSDQGRAMSVRLEDVTLTRPAVAKDRDCRDGG